MAAVLLLAVPAMAKTPAAAPSLAGVIVGTWKMGEAGDLAPGCQSAFFSGFDKRGRYWDPDSNGTYTARGAVLSVRIAGEDGRLGAPVISRLVRIVSRDELVMANDDGQFGMKRCPAG